MSQPIESNQPAITAWNPNGWEAINQERLDSILAAYKYQRLQEELLGVKKRLLRELDAIKELPVHSEHYTGHVALFVKDPTTGFRCLGVYSPSDKPGDEMPEHWDMVIPLPKPDKLPEFAGF